MSGWRHAEESLLVRWCMAPGAAAGWCTCQNPQPDPASPCAHRWYTGDLPCGREQDGPDDWHDMRTWEQDPELWHPHFPTLCVTCHHAIEATR